MSAAWSQGRSKKYAYYWCKNKECPYYAKVIAKHKIEDEFQIFLRENAINKEFADLTREILIDLWRGEKEDQLVNRIEAGKRYKDIEAKISNLSIRVSELKDIELISIYESQIKELVDKKNKLKGDQLSQNYTEKQFQTASELVFATLKEPVRMWQSKEFVNKTTIIKMYFDNKFTYDIERGFQTAKVEPTIDLINSFAVQKNTLVEMPGVEPGSG